MTPDITILGLGPGPADLRILAAQQALDAASHIYVRSHGEVDLGDLLDRPNVTDVAQFHDLTAKANRWNIAVDTVIAGGQQEPVVLAIPGHPRFGEGLVRSVLAKAEQIGLTTRVIDGVSATDMIASAIDIDPILDHVQLYAGRDLVRVNDQTPFDGGLTAISPTLPVMISHAYSNEIMSAISAHLQRVFPGDHPVLVIYHAGLPDESRDYLTIKDLQDHEGESLLAVYVPALGELEATRDPATLQHIVARLRREDGCPWDRKQNNAMLANALVDEVYEAVDAINAGDDTNLAEELGDLLLLIMMHAQIAEERGAFRLEDVYDAISTKIVRRHPHVFGNEAAGNAEDVVGLWQQVKAQERAESPAKPEKAPDGQPHSMPALERANRVFRKLPPSTAATSTPEQRQQALFDAVATIVVAGDNPDDILKSALFEYVSSANTEREQGDT